MSTLQLPYVNCRYGAPMGRADRIHPLPAAGERTHLARVYLDSGGYDNGGAYWGLGAPLWHAWHDDSPARCYIRAATREQAKRTIRAEYWPDAVFYR